MCGASPRPLRAEGRPCTAPRDTDTHGILRAFRKLDGLRPTFNFISKLHIVTVTFLGTNTVFSVQEISNKAVVDGPQNVKAVPIGNNFLIFFLFLK